MLLENLTFQRQRSVSVLVSSRCSSTGSVRGLSTTNSSSNNSNNNNNRILYETPPPLQESDFRPKQLAQDIRTAAEYNQGTDRWQVDFCRSVSLLYLQHLQYMHTHTHTQQDDDGEVHNQTTTTTPDAIHLVSPEIAERAIKGILRQHVTPMVLSNYVRQLERLIGSIAKTPLTELLSYRLLEANGKAGNVGRTQALLTLRRNRGYEPHVPNEFLYAVMAIKSAGTELIQSRNIYAGDAFQPAIDNPTRWLDAILLNMHDRGVKVTLQIANRMLETYASTGRTGKAVHHFWKMYLLPMDLQNDEHDNVSSTTGTTVRGLIDPLKLSPDELLTTQDAIVFQNRKHRAKLIWRPPAPLEKIPSEAAGVKFGESRMTKMEWEQKQDWSLPLTAAFAFADSLTHGACGHDPIELDVTSWNLLIKACCYRGALWRAIQIVDDTMPSKGIEPNAYSYTLLLDGLAKVGDVVTMKEYFRQVENKGLVTRSNVRAMVDGMINAGDVAGAITFLQDMYNQYQVIVNHYCHLKVLEVALASDLLWEAERYVTILEQMRLHEVNFALDEPEFCKAMEIFQKDPKTSRESIRKMFAYFGETLDERNFL